jgi:hypothetical protein
MLDELIPTDRETSREVSIDAVRALMAGTKNPRFEIECRSFINGFEPGDQVVEFCSAQKEWRIGMGWSGYSLIRAGELVARLLTRIS